MKEKARRLTLAIYGIDRAYTANEKRKRMSRARLNLMYALGDRNPHSQVEICRDWMVPKTTLNTIVKQWEKLGYLRQEAIPGCRREQNLILTEKGKIYVPGIIDNIYRAEDIALKKTTEQYSDCFIEALEFFGETLRAAFQEEER